MHRPAATRHTCNMVSKSSRSRRVHSMHHAAAARHTRNMVSKSSRRVYSMHHAAAARHTRNMVSKFISRDSRMVYPDYRNNRQTSDKEQTGCSITEHRRRFVLCFFVLCSLYVLNVHQLQLYAHLFELYYAQVPAQTGRLHPECNSAADKEYRGATPHPWWLPTVRERSKS